MKTLSDIRIRKLRRRWNTARSLGAVAVFCAPFALLVSNGAAQSLDPAELHALDDDRSDITHEDLTIDEIEDMDVVRDGEVIGEVEEVLGDDNEEIVALVVEYGGNVIGVGDKEVIVPIGEVEFLPGRDEVQISMTDSELAELAVWDR